MAGIEDHCSQCPRYAAMSPWVKEDLFTTPGAGDTECHHNCKCHLKRHDGLEGFKPVDLNPDSVDDHEYQPLETMDPVIPGIGKPVETGPDSTLEDLLKERDVTRGVVAPSPHEPEDDFFTGPLTVTIPNYVDREELSVKAQELFGREVSGEDLGRLIGAPVGTRVEVELYGRGDSEILVNSSAPGFTMERTFKKEGTDTIAEHQVFYIRREKNDEVLKRFPQGTGVRIFRQEVQNYLKIGVSKIRTDAVGKVGSTENGYYTWARFGFDGPIPDKVLDSAKAQFGAVKNISDILQKAGGLQWWKENGSRFKAEFDLTPDSYSMKVFQAYLKAKGL